MNKLFNHFKNDKTLLIIISFTIFMLVVTILIMKYTGESSFKKESKNTSVVEIKRKIISQTVPPSAPENSIQESDTDNVAVVDSENSNPLALRQIPLTPPPTNVAVNLPPPFPTNLKNMNPPPLPDPSTIQNPPPPIITNASDINTPSFPPLP